MLRGFCLSNSYPKSYIFVMWIAKKAICQALLPKRHGLALITCGLDIVTAPTLTLEVQCRLPSQSGHPLGGAGL